MNDTKPFFSHTNLPRLCLIAILTMLAYIEYTWLMLPSGVISICLHIATMAAHPAQITYLIFSLYSLVCVTKQFFRVRKRYLNDRYAVHRIFRFRNAAHGRGNRTGSHSTGDHSV